MLKEFVVDVLNFDSKWVGTHNVQAKTEEEAVRSVMRLYNDPTGKHNFYLHSPRYKGNTDV